MKLPRFCRRWAVRSDPHFYRSDHGPLVFRSGPFTDRFFWREKSARKYYATQNPATTTLFRLGWRAEHD